MKTPAYLLFVALTFFFSSCTKKKETPYDPSGALAAVVKTVSHSSSGTTDIYTYDGQGRIQLIQSSAGNKTTFEYDTNLITKTILDATGSVVSVNHLVLDAFGLAISSTLNDAGGAVLSYHNYYYNWGKQKTSEDVFTPAYQSNGKSEWQWGAGNLFNYTIYDSSTNNKIYDTYYWYYDPAVTSIGYNNTGQKFWGTDSKYLVRRSIRYSYIYGDVINTNEYIFDSKQRITEAKTYDRNNAMKNTDTYSYY